MSEEAVAPLEPEVPDQFRPVTRTVLQVLLAVALFVPIAVTELDVDVAQTPWLAAVVAIAAGAAKVMQSNAVDRWMQMVGLGRAPGRHEA